MKNLATLLFSLLTLAVCHAKEPTRPAAEATVIVYRPSQFMMCARAWHISLNGKKAAKLWNRQTLVLTVPAGTVSLESALSGLTIAPRRRDRLNLNVQPGRTYYVQADVRTGVLRGYLGLAEVTEASARKHAKAVEIK